MLGRDCNTRAASCESSLERHSAHEMNNFPLYFLKLKKAMRSALTPQVMQRMLNIGSGLTLLHWSVFFRVIECSSQKLKTLLLT